MRNKPKDSKWLEGRIKRLVEYFVKLPYTQPEKVVGMVTESTFLFSSLSWIDLKEGGE